MDFSLIKNNVVVVATVAVLIGMVLLSSSLFRSGLENPKIFFKEDPIDKNAQLQIRPGEQYRYSYIFNNTSANITYLTYSGPGCVGVKIFENRNATGACLDSRGNDAGGYNSSLEDPTILFFKPWMLALKEGWKWKSSMYLYYGTTGQLVSDNEYRVIRREAVGNRSAFLVEIKSSSGPIEYDWVDAEKRVLVRIEGKDYEVQRLD
ncbi:MAG: hypothetical protein U0R44_06250 [Candidatus Micrarchaeia archaeon]